MLCFFTLHYYEIFHPLDENAIVPIEFHDTGLKLHLDAVTSSFTPDDVSSDVFNCSINSELSNNQRAELIANLQVFRHSTFHRSH